MRRISGTIFVVFSFFSTANANHLIVETNRVALHSFQSDKIFTGLQRAPLFYPYQLVKFAYREKPKVWGLTDFAPPLTVSPDMYLRYGEYVFCAQETNVLATSFRGAILHGYDYSVEEYSSLKEFNSVLESIAGTNPVPFLSGDMLVQSFQDFKEDTASCNVVWTNQIEDSTSCGMRFPWFLKTGLTGGGSGRRINNFGEDDTMFRFGHISRDSKRRIIVQFFNVTKESLILSDFSSHTNSVLNFQLRTFSYKDYAINGTFKPSFIPVFTPWRDIKPKMQPIMVEPNNKYVEIVATLGPCVPQGQVNISEKLLFSISNVISGVTMQIAIPAEGVFDDSCSVFNPNCNVFPYAEVVDLPQNGKPTFSERVVLGWRLLKAVFGAGKNLFK